MKSSRWLKTSWTRSIPSDLLADTALQARKSELSMVERNDTVKELEVRRIKTSGNRQQMLRDLAAAMIKDTATGLIGDGYEFGRRFVSVEDCIEPMSDKEMRDCLKQQFDMVTTPR